MTQSSDPASDALFSAHPRLFEGNRYVYPVLSRRAGGLSVGVNLNLDKICNFDCVYCQVNRSDLRPREFVEIERLGVELEATLELISSGRIFQTERCRETPPSLRRLNDIALSGDGEPTTYRNFDEVVAACAEVRRRCGPEELKLVLITNATMFHRPRIRRALEILDANHGEIWAKLDAGTEAYYRLIVRTAIPLARVLTNLQEAARVRPLVIQSLFLRVNGQPPPPEEQEAYFDRLHAILAGGGAIKLVQVHTIARPPAERWVSALSASEVDALADFVGQRTGLPVARFYGK